MRYEIKPCGHRTRIVELSPFGDPVIIGDFPSWTHARRWLDNYLRTLKDPLAS